MQRVVERQEVLRLSFLPGKERPLQMVRANGEANLRFRELVARTEVSRRRSRNWRRRFSSEPFDLVQGPLYRVEMLRRAADDHVLVFAIHHAIADGWTLGVFVQDLFGAYISEVSWCSRAAAPRAAHLHRLGCSRARVLATGGVGAARGFLEIHSRGNSPALDFTHRVVEALPVGDFTSRRARVRSARTRPPQRRDALQHAARRVSNRALPMDWRR